jgi:hydrogenase nickel incorporation protein HypB
MCATCGCGGDGETTVLNLQTGLAARGQSLEHVHADGTRHAHAHGHDHLHTRHHRNEPHIDAHGTVIDIEARILAKNDAQATRNREWLAGRQILALNLVSAPGAGKTTLLERTIAAAHDLPLCVIEGDQATSRDGERIRRAGAPVVQLNTGSGCHLDATMVRRGLAELQPDVGSVVLIENVGNLVCPALFDLGEHAKVVIFSVTEGEDKPLKYPHMFRAAGLILLNKIDLLPHLDFSPAQAAENIRQVNPEAAILDVSARTGAGLSGWLDWLRDAAAASREFILP